MHLLAERFVFCGGWSRVDYKFSVMNLIIGCFWKKKESRPILWHQCRLLTRHIYMRLHIYSLCVFWEEKYGMKRVPSSNVSLGQGSSNRLRSHPAERQARFGHDNVSASAVFFETYPETGVDYGYVVIPAFGLLVSSDEVPFGRCWYIDVHEHFARQHGILTVACEEVFVQVEDPLDELVVFTFRGKIH